jgi:hypothetical protein
MLVWCIGDVGLLGLGEECVVLRERSIVGGGDGGRRSRGVRSIARWGDFFELARCWNCVVISAVSVVCALMPELRVFVAREVWELIPAPSTIM